MPYTLDQLEAFVSSPAYDAVTAGLIARGIPALKATGQPGELLEPGVRRIRGNLCNVHGRYGPCDKSLAGKPKAGKKPPRGKKPPKVPQTPAQRATARTAQRQANIDDVAKRMAQTDTGLGPSGSRALSAFAQGQQPSPAIGDAFVKGGLAEQASDGSYRMTPTGRAVINAMAAGDYQRAIDGLSRAADTVGKRTERQTAAQARQAAAGKRQQDAAGKRAAAQVGRELAKRQPKPAKAGSSGSKKPEQEAAEKPLKVRPTKRVARNSAPAVGSSGGAAPKPKPAEAKPSKEQQTAEKRGAVRQAMAEADAGLSPSGFDSLMALSTGAEPDAGMATGLISMGMAERGTDGTLRLTTDARAAIAAANRGDAKAAIDAVSRGQERASTRKKDFSFRIFKDASGRMRWVAQSSTAYQDRDREIVSTKALSDDVAFADSTGAYGPLRWWHCPGLDLGDCDFNAMHGRVLIESGTFRSPQIAAKVAAAAPGLEISLGFLHLPTEPDAGGVFHHIRRFERSLVPRGKASNRFTAFRVKERPMFDPTKLAALKTLGFSDDDITSFQTQAEATEKDATAQQVAYKSVVDVPETMVVNGVTYKAALPPEEDMPYTVPQEVVINGITYKAFPPKLDEAPAVEAVAEEDAAVDELPMEEEAAGGLTLSPEDLSAIGEAIAGALQGSVAQIMGALDLEKKVAGHVQGLLAPYQATKDDADAQKAEQIATLQASLKTTQDQLSELLGLQSEATPRASTAPASALNPFNPADMALIAAVKDQVPQDQQQYVNGFEDLKQKLFGS